MSISEKITNAKSTTWPANNMPKWKVFLIVRLARFWRCKMSKIKKKKKFHKLRVCECCGNEVFVKKKVFRCFYCNYLNGVEDNG